MTRKPLAPPHWAPVEYYRTAAQAQAEREEADRFARAVATEALGLPRRAAIAMVVDRCGFNDRAALALLDRVLAEETSR